MSYVAVIDYGVGNLYSLSSSLKYLGIDSVVTREPEVIKKAGKIILPGVGAFGDAMEKLRSTGLIPIIYDEIDRGTPLMGICLGMQMLLKKSYEYGEHEGLGLINGSVRPMAPDLKDMGLSYKVPHMGWNALEIAKPDCPVLKYTGDGEHMYFVHSYYGCDCQDSTAAWADYGVKVPAVVFRENVFGCQFHPEKSGRAGLDILKAFSEL
jgi:glutamine amidotransferase